MTTSTMSLRTHHYIFLSLAFLLTSCAPRDHGSTELVLWAFGAEGEHVAKMMPGFEARYPGIHVRVQMIPWNAAHEKLLTAFAGQSLPDMCQLGNTWIPEFTVLNALEPLTPWVAQSTTLRDTSFFRGIWDTNLIDSVLYGVPWYVDTRVMFYRRDLFEQVGYKNPPASWDEWFDLSARLKERFPREFAMLLPTNNEWSQPVIMGLQQGSPLLKEKDTRGDFSGPEFVEAMHAFHKFFVNGWAPARPTQIVNVYQSFAEGYYTMYITGPWNIGEFMRRLPDSLQDAWMTAPLPGPHGGIGASLAGGSSLVMFKNSKHKPEVWKLIEYLSEPEQQLQLYRLTGDLPGRVEAWRDEALAKNRYAAAFYEQLKHAVPTPKVPEWEQIAQKTREYVELVSMDVLTVEKGMQELDRQVDVILEKRRWLVFGR
jgi:multiple sugar transport system substrate-binding protein